MNWPGQGCLAAVYKYILEILKYLASKKGAFKDFLAESTMVRIQIFLSFIQQQRKATPSTMTLERSVGRKKKDQQS